MLFCLHKQTTSLKKIVNEKTLIALNRQIKEKTCQTYTFFDILSEINLKGQKMNIKISIDDFFKIDLKDGFAIKSDFSNINVSKEIAEFEIHSDNDWRCFFEELNRRISDFAYIFYVKSEKSKKEILMEKGDKFNSDISIEIKNKQDLKRLEAMCLILWTRMIYINTLNKSRLHLDYLDYQSEIIKNNTPKKYPLIFGCVKLISICHKLMGNKEIFVDKKYNDIFEKNRISSFNNEIFENKFFFKDSKVIKYLLDTKNDNVFFFISFNLIEKVIFDDQKVDLLIKLMSLINLDPDSENYFDNAEGMEGTKIYLENLFNEKEFYVVFCNFNQVEFYKIGESFVLADNLSDYSVKNSTFNLLDKRKDNHKEFITFNIKNMSSENANIMEKSHLIQFLETRSKEIEKSLHILAA